MRRNNQRPKSRRGLSTATYWLIVATAGFVFSFLLNASPLGSIGANIVLPFGWALPNPESVTIICSGTSNGYNESACIAPDTKERSHGIPFASSRQSMMSDDATDFNQTAIWLNYGFGALAACLAVLWLERFSAASIKPGQKPQKSADTKSK